MDKVDHISPLELDGLAKKEAEEVIKDVRLDQKEIEDLRSEIEEEEEKEIEEEEEEDQVEEKEKEDDEDDVYKDLLLHPEGWSQLWAVNGTDVPTVIVVELSVEVVGNEWDGFSDGFEEGGSGAARERYGEGGGRSVHRKEMDKVLELDGLAKKEVEEEVIKDVRLDKKEIEDLRSEIEEEEKEIEEEKEDDEEEEEKVEEEEKEEDEDVYKDLLLHPEVSSWIKDETGETVHGIQVMHVPLSTNSKRVEFDLCPICIKPWTFDDKTHQMSSLPCGHMFGLSCLKKWIKDRPSDKCPQCYQNFSLESVTHIYAPRLCIQAAVAQKVDHISLFELDEAEKEVAEMELDLDDDDDDHDDPPLPPHVFDPLPPPPAHLDLVDVFMYGLLPRTSPRDSGSKWTISYRNGLASVSEGSFSECPQCKALCSLKDVRTLNATCLCIPAADKGVADPEISTRRFTFTRHGFVKFRKFESGRRNFALKKRSDAKKRLAAVVGRKNDLMKRRTDLLDRRASVLNRAKALEKQGFICDLRAEAFDSG
ncbi:zinc finger, RING/FYVE/PHD-type containing protein [Tanacetum coccineum]|uniref:Zinc finger, RING/FYVE/PHD-type containing protein n=1 Tax=Tanacetum coccineum TaxID=301880 RepID=A0ABQ5CY38_9ASTR